MFLSSASDIIVAILSSYLVRAKLCLLHCKVGSKKCVKNRCEICDYYILGNTGKLRMVLDIDEKKSNSRKFDRIEKRLACKNIFIDTLVVQI